ncbi:MAG: nucleotide-diphospho-sugar transferase [Bacteriovorax sp.]|nr:nucleotide-diphospho-sugar transferase [Bacteriovorax sp.]
MTDVLTTTQALNTPVLFLVFNRLDTSTKVLEAIRNARPTRLYIAADGARESRTDEEQKVQQVRKYILGQIDWDCEVKTLFREKNLGCKKAVSEAVTWFFENEEMGIILEDDCVPSPGFFGYCENLLKRYKDDMRVWHISGANVRGGDLKSEYTYHFSVYPGVWGWASWANRWQHYDSELKQVNDESFIKNVLSNKNTIKYWTAIFHRMKAKQIDTWDFQWVFTVWMKNGFAITPNINQISNIGFGAGATHTIDPESALSKLKAGNIDKIVHPKDMYVSLENDNFLSTQYFSSPTLWERVFAKFKRSLS